MLKKAGNLIIISGPIGAGKTAVAKELVKSLPGPLIYLEGDTFWAHFLNSEGAGPRKRFRAAMRAMTSASAAYALSGFDVVLDFSIPPWFLETVKKIAGLRGLQTDYVVICPSEDVCAGRARLREEGKIESYEQYSELYADFKDSPTKAIEDDSGDPASIAQQALNGLNSGTFRLFDAWD